MSISELGGHTLFGTPNDKVRLEDAKCWKPWPGAFGYKASLRELEQEVECMLVTDTYLIVDGTVFVRIKPRTYVTRWDAYIWDSKDSCYLHYVVQDE